MSNNLEDFFTPEGNNSPPDIDDNTSISDPEPSSNTEPIDNTEPDEPLKPFPGFTPEKNPDNKPENNTILDSFLESKNINPNEITIFDELGNQNTAKFSDLSEEEQLELLSQSDYEVSEDERLTLEYLRKNNITLSDYESRLREQIELEFNNKPAESDVNIDNYSDEDLYAAYMKNLNPELSDSDLSILVENAKQTPEVFEKITSKLKEDFVNGAEEEASKKQAELIAQEEAKQLEYSTRVTDIANKNLNQDFYGFDLAPEEHQETLNFILEQNDLGQTRLEQILESPENLYRAATLLVHADKMFSFLQSNYKPSQTPQEQKPKAVSNNNNKQERELDENEKAVLNFFKTK